jgi:hypothetical protein
VASGTRLTTDLVNDIINRTEYAADLLRQYKLIAGNGMYVEPHFDGTRVSYLQQVAGGATPTRPPYNDGSDPNNPLTEAEVLSRFTEENNEAGNIVFPDPFNIYLDLSGIVGFWIADDFFYARSGQDQTLTFSFFFFPGQGNPPNSAYWSSLGYNHFISPIASITQIGAGPPYGVSVPTKLVFVPV